MLRSFPLLIVLASLHFSGCGSGDSSESGVLRINNGTEVQDLDPHLTTGVPEHRTLAALFEGLVDLDMATLDPRPGVAERWDLSEDGRVYTFHLRQNAKWSNGDIVTAHDFVYAWQRMLSPALAAEYAYFLYLLENGEAYNNGEITDFAQVGVKAPDDFTLVVTLKNPTPYFLQVHQHQAWYPVHRATIEAHGDPLQRGNPWTRAGSHVGNGPFLLTEWHPNEILSVRKNPEYWDAENVRLEGIDFYPIQDQQTEERSFRAGELDWTQEVPLHRVGVYQRENPELITIHPYLGVYYYRLNVTRPALADKRVRQALALSLNREELTKNVLQAGEQPAFTFVPPMEGHVSPNALEYNVERARELLAEAGFPGGQGFPELEILYNTMESHKVIAETVQRMWSEALGIRVQLLNQDWKVYLDNMDSLNYDIARSGWISDFVDPINYLDTMTSWSGNNRTGWKSAPYDEAVKLAESTVDLEPRARALQAAEAQIIEELPLIPIYFYTRKFLKDPKVQGYANNPLGYIRWKDIYLDEAEK